MYHSRLLTQWLSFQGEKSKNQAADSLPLGRIEKFKLNMSTDLTRPLVISVKI